MTELASGGKKWLKFCKECAKILEESVAGTDRRSGNDIIKRLTKETVGNYNTGRRKKRQFY